MTTTVKMFECIHALKALGEENRLRIVRLLIGEQASVNDIANTLGMTQYNASKHLRILREAGLVETTKNGQQRLYSLDPTLRSHLAENNNILDLGCCTFRFDQVPPPRHP